MSNQNNRNAKMKKPNIRPDNLVQMDENQENVIKVDGSKGEGGGQILRVTSMLSAILCKPCHIEKIRAKRSTSGLGAQHVATLELVRDLCGGYLQDALDSTALPQTKCETIVLTPSANGCPGGKFVADPKTAGSVTLMIQSALPVAMFSKSDSDITMMGGTNVEYAPTIEYFLHVLLPMLKRMGTTADAEIVKRGYYPKGGGAVNLKVCPMKTALKPIDLTERGKIVSIRGIYTVRGEINGQNQTVYGKELESATRSKLEDVVRAIDDEPKISVEWEASDGKGVGSCLVLYATTSTGCVFASSAIGKGPNKGNDPAESVASKAVDGIATHLQSKTCVDNYLADQIIPYMALAKGTSRFRIGTDQLPIENQHMSSSIFLVEEHLGVKFTTTKLEDGTTIMECTGIGKVVPT